MVRLFRVFIPAGTLVLLLFEAILVPSSFIIATYLLLESDPYIFLFYEGGMWRILIATATVLIAMHFHDLYTSIHIKSRILLLQQLSLTMGLAFLTMGLLSYVDKNMRMPIRVMVLGSAIAMAGILCWRILFASYLSQIVGAQRVLFLGSN